MLVMFIDSFADPLHFAGQPDAPELTIGERERRLKLIIRIFLVLRDHPDVWYFYDRRLRDRLLRRRYFSIDYEVRLLEAIDVPPQATVARSMLTEIRDAESRRDEFRAFALADFDKSVIVGSKTEDPAVVQQRLASRLRGLELTYRDDFSANVVASSVWPFERQTNNGEPAVNVPEHLRSQCDTYEAFYKKFNPRRKLQWAFDEGNAIVDVTLDDVTSQNKQRTISFDVSTVAMCILLLFSNNPAGELTAQEIHTKVGSSYETVSNALKALVAPGQDVLQVRSKGESSSELYFSLNHGFELPKGHDPATPVVVHRMRRKLRGAADETVSALYEWRREVINTAIVSIVKRETTKDADDNTQHAAISRKALVDRVVAHCAQRFVAKAKDVVQQIQWLVQREYVTQVVLGDSGELGVQFLPESDFSEETAAPAAAPVVSKAGKEKAVSKAKEQAQKGSDHSCADISSDNLAMPPPLSSDLSRQFSTASTVRDKKFLPSTPASRCLSNAQLEEELEAMVAMVSSVLEISADEVERLLILCHWDVLDTIQRYVSNSAGIRELAGLAPLEAAEGKSSAENSDEEFMCPTCIDTVPRSQTLALWCNHRYCRSCWLRWLQSNITEKNTGISTKCMGPKCPARLLTSHVRTIDSKVFGRYRKLMLKSFVSESPNMIWCQNPRCNAILWSERIETITRLSTFKPGCSLCQTKFMCTRCDYPAHSPASCQNVADWDGVGGFIDSSTEARNNMRLMAHITKGCPKCHARIQKNEGCPHMKCRSCQGEFCWACLGPYPKCFCRMTGADRLKLISKDQKGGNQSEFEQHNRLCVFNAERRTAIRVMLTTAAKYAGVDQAGSQLRMTNLVSYLQVVRLAARVFVHCRQVLIYSQVFRFFTLAASQTEQASPILKLRYSLYDFARKSLQERTDSLQTRFESPKFIREMLSVSREDESVGVGRHLRSVCAELESLRRQLSAFLEFSGELVPASEQ